MESGGVPIDDVAVQFRVATADVYPAPPTADAPVATDGVATESSGAILEA